LRAKYGENNVIASDIKTPPREYASGPFVYLDVMNRDNLAAVMLEHRIDWVFHLATVLSAVGKNEYVHCRPPSSQL
jgi:nucleoside-diphosphate-sugar epimerase